MEEREEGKNRNYFPPEHFLLREKFIRELIERESGRQITSMVLGLPIIFHPEKRERRRIFQE